MPLAAWLVQHTQGHRTHGRRITVWLVGCGVVRWNGMGCGGVDDAFQNGGQFLMSTGGHRVAQGATHKKECTIRLRKTAHASTITERVGLLGYGTREETFTTGNV